MRAAQLWFNHLRRSRSRFPFRAISNKSAPTSTITSVQESTWLTPSSSPFLRLVRPLSSGQSLVSPDGVVRSPHKDISIPEIPFHELVFGYCDKHGDIPAMEDFVTKKSYTYAQVKANAIKVASALHRMGYRKGDVVMAYSTNTIDYTIAFLACASLGIWFSAYNPESTSEELARALTMTESQAIFTVPPLLPVVQKALEQTDPSKVKIKDIITFGENQNQPNLPFQKLLDDDGGAFPSVKMNPREQVLAQVFSSGTTALPKCAQLSHYNFVANILQLDLVVGYEKFERFDGLLPFYHMYGLLIKQFLGFPVASFSSVLPMFDPQMYLQCLQDVKVTVANLVPPLVHFLATHPIVDKYDLSSLTTMTSGAAPLSKEILKQFKQRFPYIKKYREGYGMTEILVVTYNTNDVPGAVGHLVPNTYGKVVDLETGAVLGPGQTGELCHKGPQTMLGYYKNPEANMAMMKPDGWVHTGDVGYYSEDGVFFITDRIKDMIKYKAKQIAPAELENLLQSHAGVLDVAVIGVPDERAGEVPKAFVARTPNSNVTEEELSNFVAENTNKTMRLRGGVVFVDAIPKSPSGKILKRVLREY